jgi:ectoine hydroxylase-related dioxygenase (phytanoyl-CoA dioxygenase family)
VQLRELYLDQGFILKRDLLSDSDLQSVEQRCLAIVENLSGKKFSGLKDRELTKYLIENRSAEQFLYDEIRRHPELTHLSRASSICDVIRSLLGKSEIVLLEKIPFRIDCPLVLRELAVWHQDLHYVKGSAETITAWIPLFDVSFKEGCLLVMPESHKSGPITHDVPVLGKKFYPSGIFDRPVRYVEMKRGDVLFFNSQLLHSSGNNISDEIRFSIQSRYAGADVESDAAMGSRIPV